MERGKIDPWISYIWSFLINTERLAVWKTSDKSIKTPDVYRFHSNDSYIWSASLTTAFCFWKHMSGSSHALCYTPVRSCAIHNSFTSYGGDVICANPVPLVSAIIAYFTLREFVSVHLCMLHLHLIHYLYSIAWVSISSGKTSGPTTKAAGSEVLL